MTGNVDLNTMLARAKTGDQDAVAALLEAHRHRLRRMVRVHFDPRIAPRVDPSDVVQETLVEATDRFAEYLNSATVGIYPWLRELAYQRLVAAHRRHIRAQKRSVVLEAEELPLPDASAMRLAERIVSEETTPSQRLLKAEMRESVRNSLKKLRVPDRKVLILRFLEQLSTAETAEILGITSAAVSVRQLRALRRFKDMLKSSQ